MLFMVSYGIEWRRRSVWIIKCICRETRVCPNFIVFFFFFRFACIYARTFDFNGKVALYAAAAEIPTRRTSCLSWNGMAHNAKKR